MPVGHLIKQSLVLFYPKVPFGQVLTQVFVALFL